MLATLVVTLVVTWNAALAGLPTPPTAHPAVAELFAELPVDPTVDPLDRLLRSADDLRLMDVQPIDLNKHIADCKVLSGQCICDVPEGCEYVHTPNSCHTFNPPDLIEACPVAQCRIRCP